MISPFNELWDNWALGYLWSRNISHNAIQAVFTTWRRDVQKRGKRKSADAADLFASPEIFSTRKQVSMPSSTLQLVRHEDTFTD